MTLPEVCPLDESQTCKGRECHLFCLEWRTKEPTCLIGYSTTSKIKSGKADRNRDTYAEDTFRKLGKQPLSNRRHVFEKGDWIPSRSIEKTLEKPVERIKESFTPSRHLQESSVNPPYPKPERNHDERLRERYAASDAEKTSIKVESILRKDSVEQDPVICSKNQLKIPEKPRASEKVISIDKHTTIFAAFDDKKDNSYLPGRDEEARKSPENREKHKKLDKVMEIDLPDTYDEEFLS